MRTASQQVIPWELTGALCRRRWNIQWEWEFAKDEAAVESIIAFNMHDLRQLGKNDNKQYLGTAPKSRRTPRLNGRNSCNKGKLVPIRPLSLESIAVPVLVGCCGRRFRTPHFVEYSKISRHKSMLSWFRG